MHYLKQKLIKIPSFLYRPLPISKPSQPQTSVCRLRQILLFIIFLVVIVTIFVHWDEEFAFPFSNTYTSNANHSKISRLNSSIFVDENDTTVILMWTMWFQTKLFEGYVPHCSRKCLVTYDRSYLNESRALIFHTKDHNFGDIPPKRDLSKYYVFFVWESPQNTGGSFNTPEERSFFNLTLTYRKDSDIFAPYGKIVKRTAPLKFDLSKLAKEKSRPIAWMVSHCGTWSRREVLVKLLQEYIPVDVYGSCGQYKCQNEKMERDTEPASCGQTFEDKYKFYLSFENALCRDYVTEKFFSRLRRYVVPVVLERKNYEHYCPEYRKPWFIAVDDFETVKELGSYLQHLHQNSTAYYEYLSWHENYETMTFLSSDANRLTDYFCDLCHLVRKGQQKIIKDVVDWWSTGMCHTKTYCNNNVSVCI